MISMIAAMAKDRVIGLNNSMPWHMPADLQHFKRLTTGKTVLMGRKTYDSIGRALPNRRNLVVSRQPAPANTEAEWFSSLEQALAATRPDEEVMVMGGAEIYRQCLAKAKRLYLTQIDAELTGDTWFPDYQAVADWRVLASESHPADAKNPFSYQFIILERLG
ncbi:type 3 dihydrofolate reductase [Alkalimonas delamerensis]|uniref:Dihydrofolate reductase n=1 Tax=Alkalimonas delamerensis TaxID=265981 RepID=A0ABT9GKY6_9GAMM|nr:type 3 dihydrofolate reductase [Alkalimonas delamerensis]MDP4527631.1 type 3 dihydrofolate reductase [Alkalimonas delamerensis]